MLSEPTIHQIEELLKAFREQGGSDAELSAIAQDIIRDFRPETVRPTKEVFDTGHPKEVKQILDFKNDGKKPVHQALSDIWKHWYIKYPIAFVAIFGIVFSAANLPLFLAKSAPVENSKKEAVSLIPKKNETSAPLEPGETIASSPTLIVPKIGVTAPVVFVNTTEEASIQEGLRSGVVHYYQTALPGEVGNSFITGHSSNYWWDKGAYNYIFANLDKLAVGDQAKIYYNGKKYLYQVREVKVVEATEMSVLDQTPKPTLTLMTCTPPGTSWKRLIVSFDQVAPVYQSRLVGRSNTNSSNNEKSLPKSDSNPALDWFINLFSGLF